MNASGLDETGSLCAPVSRRSLLALLALPFASACEPRGPKLGAEQKRYVSTSPSMTEAVFALGRGEALVGRTRYCDQPTEAARVAIVGGFADPSVEAIVALAPSLVCGERGPAGPDLPRRLAEHGIATYFPELDRVAQVEAMLVELGARLDAAKRGRELARALRGAVDEVAAATPSSVKPRVVLLFDLDPLVAASDDCFPGELLALAGAENPVKGPSKYPRLGAEGLLALDPDVIIDASSMVRSENARDPRVIVPGFAELRAVREGRLRSLGSTASLRPGPRLGEGLRELARLVHGKVS